MSSTASSDLATVLSLAALTEDRTPAEQRALERVARRLDRDRNRFTGTNRRFDHAAPRLPCTAPWHRDEKCTTCHHPGDAIWLLLPPFRAEAQAEALVDADGWSVALQAIREGVGVS